MERVIFKSICHGGDLIFPSKDIKNIPGHYSIIIELKDLPGKVVEKITKPKLSDETLSKETHLIIGAKRNPEILFSKDGIYKNNGRSENRLKFLLACYSLKFINEAFHTLPCDVHALLFENARYGGQYINRPYSLRLHSVGFDYDAVEKRVHEIEAAERAERRRQLSESIDD